MVYGRLAVALFATSSTAVTVRESGVSGVLRHFLVQSGMFLGNMTFAGARSP